MGIVFSEDTRSDIKKTCKPFAGIQAFVSYK